MTESSTPIDTGPDEVVVDWSAFAGLVGGGSTAPGAASASERRGLVVIAAILWVVSLVLVFITWNGVQDRNLVELQMPILASGGLSSIVLAIIGAAVFSAGMRRG